MSQRSEKLERAQAEMEAEADHVTVGPATVLGTKSQTRGAFGGVLVGALIGAVLGAIVGALIGGTGFVIALIVFAIGGAVVGFVSGGYAKPEKELTTGEADY